MPGTADQPGQTHRHYTSRGDTVSEYQLERVQMVLGAVRVGVGETLFGS